jgi:rod shape-determining protein MreC
MLRVLPQTEKNRSMRNRRAQSHIAILPGSGWVRNASRGLLIGAALVLFAMSKTGNPVAANLRATILDTVTPVIAVAASPFDAVSDAGDWFKGLVAMRAENVQLKNQNLQLLQWQSMAKRMESENASLKQLMNVVPEKKTHYVTAHLVSDLGGPYAKSALINGGKTQGIKIDQAVINEDGLIGRVIETAETSARVLLLADINSRVPVMAERTRQKTILAGNSTGLPTLSYLPGNNDIQIGDRIVTSGDGGIFPAGIPVGVVASASGSIVAVQPYADITRVEYISAIDYSF